MVLILAIGSTGSTKGDTGLTIKAGFGYEFLSQEFFLDSLEFSGADSLETTTALKTTYLDDVKGQLSLSYLPYEDYRLELRSVLEQTPDQFRFRLNADYRPRFGSAGLDWNSEIEWRDDNSSSISGNMGYLAGNTRAKLMLPISSSSKIRVQVKSDFVRFDSAGFGAFDYYRLGGQLGISQRVGTFSTLTGSAFIMSRAVPDTTDLDYLSYGLDGTFFGIYGQGELDALGRYEIRDYDRDRNVGDYRRLELSARNRHRLGRKYFLREELEIEALSYDSPGSLYQEYERVEVTLMAGFSLGYWSFAAGPEFEILAEQQADELVTGEDYEELGLKTQLDLLSLGKVFGSLESVTGRRNLTDEGGADNLHSDFVFERLDLLADWTVGGGLSLSLLFSADWEWHQNQAENSRLMLLSTSVYYTF